MPEFNLHSSAGGTGEHWFFFLEEEQILGGRGRGCDYWEEDTQV